MNRQNDRKPRPESKSQELKNREEIQDVLSDEGYSADQRKESLKTLLTELAAEQSKESSPERERLIEEIKEIVDTHQSGKPKSDDVL